MLSVQNSCTTIPNVCNQLRFSATFTFFAKTEGCQTRNPRQMIDRLEETPKIVAMGNKRKPRNGACKVTKNVMGC